MSTGFWDMLINEVMKCESAAKTVGKKPRIDGGEGIVKPGQQNVSRTKRMKRKEVEVD